LKTRFRVTALLVLALLLLQIAVGRAQPALSAPGDVVADVVTTDGAYANNSVAFDGRYLYFADLNGTVLHRIDMPAAGGQTGPVNQVNFPITGVTSGGINTFAYDAGRDAFWTAGSDGLSIYLMSKTGAAALRFRIDPLNDRPGDCKRLGGCLAEINGLAYDRSDDTLWYNADATERIYHYQTYADTLGTAVLVGSNPYLDIDVAPNDMYAQCGWNSSSGIAVGGSHLFLGSSGCSYYFEYTKTGTKVATYPYAFSSAQDFECDNLTYGASVIWMRDAWDWHIRAFEQPAADACLMGGGAAPVPTPTPLLPPLPLPVTPPAGPRFP